MSEPKLEALSHEQASVDRPSPGDPRWDVLTDYVTKLQAEFGMARWEIMVITGEPPDDASTFIEQATADHRESSDWYFGNRFFATDREEQRAAIVHELVHLFITHAWHDVQRALKNALAPGMWHVVEPPHTAAYERSVDRLAMAIAPKYDLIEWPELTTQVE